MVGAWSHLEASILASLEPGIGCLRSGAQGRLSAYIWLLCGAWASLRWSYFLHGALES